MPIALLPDATTRAIGSSLVLNDACSVVKELVDNALDALATSIIIEISADTLEVIQVHDNGHGIGVDDRRLVCKRGCTSKIRTMQDLEQLGGSSLGFRGEALASVAELSEAVIVTTRVEGEHVGTALKLGRDGRLLNSSSASHLVGTTLRVQGFLQALPVRKQTAKKGAPKTLGSIRKLLYGYAFARPFVRISFKVLKAKNDKANWSYGPQPGPTSLKDATSKIAGKEVAGQCELRSMFSEPEEPGLAEQSPYSIDAVLVKANADASKIHNVGQYISVDGRPVSARRGIIKDIIKLYNSYYRSASSIESDVPSATDPFLCMHLSCPPESYDINIEPAKDDVLFSNSPRIMSLFKSFFEQYYGELSPSTQTKTRPGQKERVGPVTKVGFNILLAKKPSKTAEEAVPNPPKSPERTSSAEEYDRLSTKEHYREIVLHPGQPEPVASQLNSHDQPVRRDSPEMNFSRSDDERTSPSHSNMYTVSDEDLLALGSPPPTQDHVEVEDEGNQHRGAQATNPWSLAKLHAPMRHALAEPKVSATPDASFQLMTPSTEPCGSKSLRDTFKQGGSRSRQSILASPATSSPSPAGYQNPGPPLRRRPYNEHEEQGEDDVLFTQDFASDTSAANANTLDTWVQPQPSTGRLPASQSASHPHTDDAKSQSSASAIFNRPKGSLGSLSPIQHINPNEEAVALRTSINSANKPFGSPFRVSNSTARPTNASSTTLNAEMTCSDVLHESQSILWQTPVSSQWQSIIADNNGNGLQRHSSPSPVPRSFKASQPPNKELDDILDFEQRKKAVVTQHRKANSSYSLGKLNPAKLAQLHQKSHDMLAIPTSLSQPRSSVPNTGPTQDINPACNYAKRLDNSQVEQLTTTASHNSPHENRYQAAKQRLGPVNRDDNNLRQAIYGTSGDEMSMTANESTNHRAELRIPESDPRAYLIKHRENANNSNGSAGLTKTGLKIRRTKTARLPLESVPLGAALHELNVINNDAFPAAHSLCTRCVRHSKFDDYVKTGKNKFHRWSANSRDVKAWEMTVNDLICRNFRAEVADGEVVVPKVSFALTTAIKVHVDVHGL